MADGWEGGAHRHDRGVQTQAALGLLWAVFSLILAWRGEQPSNTGLPIPAESYYLVQGLLIFPLVWLAHRLAAWVVGQVVGGGTRRWVDPLGISLGAAPLFCLAIPDMVAYALGGMEALRDIMPYVLPLAGLGSLLWTLRVLSHWGGAHLGRKIGAAGVGWLSYWLLISLLLR